MDHYVVTKFIGTYLQKLSID
uniref:Uncharacterized protein n=1 Tax=Arundo donax TaxID=35708 RepID=A0A0A9A519_ARUDO